MRRSLLFLFTASAALAQNNAPASRPLVDRVGDTAFVQLEADSFQKLSPRQQVLAYWLTQASIAIAVGPRWPTTSASFARLTFRDRITPSVSMP